MLYAPEQLSKSASLLLQRGDVPLHVSAASVWEAAIKKASGKMDWLSDSFPTDIQEAGLPIIPVTDRQAWRVRELAAEHLDPFDRLLIALATLEGLTLVTRDRAMSRYGVDVIRA